MCTCAHTHMHTFYQKLKLFSLTHVTQMPITESQRAGIFRPLLADSPSVAAPPVAALPPVTALPPVAALPPGAAPPSVAAPPPPTRWVFPATESSLPAWDLPHGRVCCKHRQLTQR